MIRKPRYLVTGTLLTTSFSFHPAQGTRLFPDALLLFILFPRQATSHYPPTDFLAQHSGPSTGPSQTPYPHIPSGPLPDTQTGPNHQR